MIRLFVVLLLVAKVASFKALDTKKFPCHKYLNIISDWPDGFRGKLNLPAIKKVKYMKEAMKAGDIILTFNKPIRTFDAPQTDQSKQIVSEDGKKYSVFIKFRSVLNGLNKGQSFHFDISVHFPRSEKGKIGIVAIQFGDFLCPVPEPTMATLPVCNIEKIDNSQPDGYRAKMLVPIGETSYKKWNLEISFTRPILVLDVPHAEKENPSARNVKVFKVHNLRHNGHGKGPTFELEFMVHFDRNAVAKKDVKISQIKFNGEIKCQSAE